MARVEQITENGRACQSRHPGIAVVLSGLDEDGAAALRTFEQRSGVAIVQEPQSAVRPEMPLPAIHTGCVDYVLAPGAIAGQLEKLVEHLGIPDSLTRRSYRVAETAFRRRRRRLS